MLLVSAFVLSNNSCSILNQSREFENLAKCRYFVKDINIISIGGLSVEQFKKGKDLPFDEYLTLLEKLLSKNIDSKFVLTVTIINPTGKPAGASGLEYKMLKDELEFAEGGIDSVFLVEPQSNTDVNINVNLNLFRLLKSVSFSGISELSTNPDWKNIWEKSGVIIKLRPWYKIGSKVRKYPGYITLRP